MSYDGYTRTRNVNVSQKLKQQYDELLARQQKQEDKIKSLKLALKEAYVRHDIIADKLEAADPRQKSARITKGEIKEEFLGNMSVYVIRHYIWYLTMVLDTDIEREQSFGKDWKEKLALLQKRLKEIA